MWCRAVVMLAILRWRMIVGINFRQLVASFAVGGHGSSVCRRSIWPSSWSNYHPRIRAIQVLPECNKTCLMWVTQSLELGAWGECSRFLGAPRASENPDSWPHHPKITTWVRGSEPQKSVPWQCFSFFFFGRKWPKVGIEHRNRDPNTGPSGFQIRVLPTKPH